MFSPRSEPDSSACSISFFLVDARLLWSPAQACSPPGPDSHVPRLLAGGSIALVERGQCTFMEKVINLQQSGASAVLIFDISNDSEPMIMVGIAFISLILVILSIFSHSLFRVMMVRNGQSLFLHFFFATLMDCGSRIAFATFPENRLQLL